MGIENAPISFGFPCFVRNFLPGLISSILATYILAPLIQMEFSNIQVLNTFLHMPIIEKIFVIVILSFIFGMILELMDLYIYQFLEGIRYWGPLWGPMYDRSLKSFRSIKQDINSKKDLRRSISDEKELIKINNQIKSLFGKLRRYPYREESIEATAFGNVIAEYETYPEEQYGMNFKIYWSRLRCFLPENIKNELDSRSAKADFIVYLTFIFIIFLPIVTTSAYTFFGLIIATITFVFWIIITYQVLYKLAINEHNNYGGYVKSIFDLYRMDLAKKLGLPRSICPNDDEKSIWSEYSFFLDDYDYPDAELFCHPK